MSATQSFGIMNLFDISGDGLLAEQSKDKIVNAVTKTLAEHNAEVNALIDAFCNRTINSSTRVLLPGSGELQAMDENGRALPRKGAEYNVAFPIHGGGDAWAANYVTLNKMSVQRFAQLTAGMLQRDMLSITRLILGGILYDQSWTFNDTYLGQTLTVQPMANGDTVVYPITNATGLSTDNHYRNFAYDTISDANNPFPEIAEEIMQHGDNTGDVVAFIPTAMEAGVRTLDDFTPAVDPNIAIGISKDRIVSTPQGFWPGEIIGYLPTAHTWVSKLRSLPDDYLIAITETGPKPLNFREDAEKALRGFGPKGNRDDFPYFEEQWLRRCGVGAYNRVGAVAAQISAEASSDYTAPANFDPRRLGR